MRTAAYCSECNGYVWVGQDGNCSNGHGRPNLRDVHKTDSLPSPIGMAPDNVPDTPTAPEGTQAQLPSEQTKPLRGLTKTLRGIIALIILTSVFAVAAGAYNYYEYSAMPPTTDITETFLPSDAVHGLVALVQVALYVALMVTFLMWVYRTNKNLRVLSGERMRFTPGWAVGWYFIPILNLFKPYQSMKEIWQVSHRHSRSSSLVGVWWSLWIASSILSQLAAQSLGWGVGLSGYLSSTIMYMVSDSFDIIVTSVLLLLVTRIWDAYTVNIAEGVGTAAAQPPAAMSPLPPATIPAGWYADPAHRHELRYWDGANWSASVMDAGMHSHDPL